MSQPDLTVEWYYVTSAGDQAGPVNIDELRSQYQSKNTHNECLCWNEALEGWTMIKDVPSLISYIAPKGPPPLPRVPTISISLPPLLSASTSLSSSQIVPLSPTASPLPAESPTSASSQNRAASPSPSPSANYNTNAPRSPTSSVATTASATRKNKQTVIAANKDKYKTLKKDKVGSGTLTKSNTGNIMNELMNKSNKAKTLKLSSSTAGITDIDSQSASAASLPLASLTAPIPAPLYIPIAVEPVIVSSAPSRLSESTVVETTQLVSSPPTTLAVLPSDPIAAAEYISQQLIYAISTLDLDRLTYWLNQGDMLQIDENHYVISPLARMYSSKIEECHRLINEAMQSMDEGALLYGIYYADCLGYDSSIVQACRRSRDTIIQLNRCWPI